MKEYIEKAVSESLASIKSSLPNLDSSEQIEIEVPKRREFGDFSTNIALILSKKLGKKPRELAELIINNLPEDGKTLFKKTEVAGAGFINFYVKEEAIINSLLQIEKLGHSFGNSNAGKGEKILVEFVSANPTGFLHMGHARNASVGDAISNILTAAGYDITREFYINDAGKQIENLGLSVFRRYEELFGIKKGLPEDGYHGEYIKELAQELREEKGDSLLSDETAAVSYCKDFAKARLLDEIKKDLSDFGVTFDVWYSEDERIHKSGKTDGEKNKLAVVKNKLDERGALEEKEGALWFKATSYGDSQDWVLVKRDGSSTYFLSDIAYHYDKIDRGFKKLINIWGADHHSHVGRLKASLRALGFDDANLNVVLIQFVRLISGGKEVSMSKRTGSYVTMREVIQEVGRDVMRFFLLMRSSDTHLDFDLDLAKKESNENPVYYIQYVHARIGSIFEKAKEKELTPSKEFLNLLSTPEEMEIMKKLLSFPEVVKEAAAMLSPHRIAFYLQEIASEFHVYYTNNRVVGDDTDLSRARLYFINCIRTVVRNGLKLLGVSAPERM